MENQNRILKDEFSGWTERLIWGNCIAESYSILIQQKIPDLKSKSCICDMNSTFEDQRNTILFFWM